MDTLPETIQVVLTLLAMVLMGYLSWYFSKRTRSHVPSTLTERGKLLLEERIPVVRHLSAAHKTKLYESVMALRKVGRFQSRHLTTAGGYDFFDIKTDDQAILFGLMALAMLNRSVPIPEQVFPLIITDETVVSTDPIFRGTLKKGALKFISRDDLHLDSHLHALGISPLVYQFARCLDEPDMLQATREHRAGFNALLDTLNAAYERIIMAPARAQHEETGETVDVLSGIGFLFESQKVYFGTYDEFNKLDSEVKGALASLYGERRILN